MGRRDARACHLAKEPLVPSTILAVDDSVTMRKVLELTFVGAEFELVTVDSAGAAIERIKAARPALVIADVSLPPTDGYELCNSVKLTAPDVPVLMLSSKHNPFDPGKGARAEAHIDKPFDTEEMLKRARETIQAGAKRAQPEPRPAAEPPVADAVRQRRVLGVAMPARVPGRERELTVPMGMDRLPVRGAPPAAVARAEQPPVDRPAPIAIREAPGAGPAIAEPGSPAPGLAARRPAEPLPLELDEPGTPIEPAAPPPVEMRPAARPDILLDRTLAGLQPQTLPRDRPVTPPAATAAPDLWREPSEGDRTTTPGFPVPATPATAWTPRPAQAPEPAPEWGPPADAPGEAWEEATGVRPLPREAPAAAPEADWEAPAAAPEADWEAPAGLPTPQRPPPPEAPLALEMPSPLEMPPVLEMPPALEAQAPALEAALEWEEPAHAPPPEPPAPLAEPAAPPAPEVPAPAAAPAAGPDGRLGPELQQRLAAMGLTQHQIEGVLALAHDVVERVVWEVVPNLAEVLIREEIARLTSE
ncbi:MAG: response regulator [Deltaproteobacteria bacterium]|nr:response regulator [Deltaproteobacteria bacterium]